MITEIKEWNYNTNNRTPLHIAALNDSNIIGELLIFPCTRNMVEPSLIVVSKQSDKLI